MADDDDFDYDDDELDDEVDEEIDDGGAEEMDDDDEDEDDDDEDEEEQAQKAVVNNKLKKLQKDVETRPLPIYIGNEKKTIQQGKKVNPTLTKSIEAKMLVKRANLMRNVITIGGPILIGIAVVCLVVFLIIAAMNAMDSPFSNKRQPSGSGDDGGYSFALNGEQIYSVRAIYTDDTMSKNRLVADYGKLVANAVAQYNTDNNPYDIAITLPTPQGYDYSLLFGGYSSNQYLYKQLAELTYIFAENVNLEYGARGDTSTYAALLDDIQYFGLEQQVARSATQAVADKIVEQNWFTKMDDNAQPIDSNDLADELMQTINDDVGAISEKVFVADYQLEGKMPLPWLLAGDDDEHPTRQYKAIVYFPKKDLEFNMSSYLVVTKKLGEIMVYNGSESYNLTAKLVNGDNYSYDAENINFTAQKTDASAVDIGECGTVAELYNQLSKADAQAEIEKFFKTEDVGGRQVYKFVPSGFYAEFNFDAPFDVCDNNNLYS